MKCSVEQLAINEDMAWIVSVDNILIGELIVQFTAFQHNKISQILLEDRCRKHKLRIEYGKKVHRNIDHPINLIIDDCLINGVGEWLEAVLSFMYDIYIKGWSPADHIDYDFYQNGKYITISFYVNPPS